MAILLSKALRNFVLSQGSWKNALQNGVIKVYSGAPPVSADVSTVGAILLGTFSDTGLTPTLETQAIGGVTLTGGAAGSINTVTMGGINLIGSVGAVPFNSSLSQTAQDLAAAINRDQIYGRYTASALGAAVTIYAPVGTGAFLNGNVVACTSTTITTTTSNLAGGVAATNGLRLSYAAGGVLAKDPFQIWRSMPVSNGVATFFRFVSSRHDADVADTTESQVRVQGDVGTTGAALNLLSTTLTAGFPTDINTFTLTELAS